MLAPFVGPPVPFSVLAVAEERVIPGVSVFLCVVGLGDEELGDVVVFEGEGNDRKSDKGASRTGASDLGNWIAFGAGSRANKGLPLDFGGSTGFGGVCISGSTGLSDAGLLIGGFGGGAFSALSLGAAGLTVAGFTSCGLTGITFDGCAGVGGGGGLTRSTRITTGLGGTFAVSVGKRFKPYHITI